MNTAILIMSDRSSRGERPDASGPALEKWLAERGESVQLSEVIPDDEEVIVARLTELADSGAFDLILTCGGTGVSLRDVTPDATRRVIAREIPGFGEAMRAESRKITPHALISRALAGIRGQALIVNLPGSPKGALENLAAVWSAIPHAIAKLQGDTNECGQLQPAEVPRAKAISFVARSGTGKTTLLEKVIFELKKTGWRVGAIKHDAHSFDIDYPGKDSHRLTVAGADTMLISSREKLALVKQHVTAPPVSELVDRYFTNVDIVLVEGFTQGGLHKIEVHRSCLGASLICRGDVRDPDLVAIASDVPLQSDVPVFDINDAVGIAAFLAMTFLEATGAREK